MSFLKTKYLLLTFLILMLISCGTTQKITKEFRVDNDTSSFFKGFVLYNPESKKEIINHNGAKYFTPASNTKLFTFYTAYKTLKDSVKSLAYYKTNDSIVIKGTADPSLLYFGKDSVKVIDFLKNQTDSIYMLDASIDEAHYGSGWAWDDYSYYYMPDKSLFPIYGNILNYKKSGDSLIAIPTFFKKHITVLDSISVTRDLNHNRFYVEKESKRTYHVPFKTSNELTATLLSEQIGKSVTLIPAKKRVEFNYLYGSHYDDLFKELLVVSDNFIAEQLMLQVSNEVDSTYNVQDAIRYSLENYLKGIPQEPRWVDGSGLSRYNLCTPSSLVFLLEKMYQEIPRQKLLNYFPVGGESGTLKNWYDNDRPFVYAKSGTLSNNYSLSGYLITKKGTLLIFSYMNNHYKIATSEVKKEMEIVLKEIYNHY